MLDAVRFTGVWIFGSFFISAKEIRVSRKGLFCSGTETHGYIPGYDPKNPERVKRLID
jgi:hypothetical protein